MTTHRFFGTLPPLLGAFVALYIVQSPGFISGVIVAPINWTCAQLYNDVPSRTALATIVFEGRARRLESLPSSVKQVDRELFNVTFKPRRLFKGNLPRTAEGNFEIITVGVFGAIKDLSACVPSVQLGSRYLVFLQGQGAPSEYDHRLSFYQIFSFPELFSPESASLVAEHSCSNCTSVPTVLLAQSEFEVKFRQKLLFRCLVTGRPDPVIKWYRNGLEIVATKRVRIRKTKYGVSLRINKVKLEDAGSYSCHASNILGQVSSNTSLISVSSATTSFKPHAVRCSSQNFCVNEGVCYTILALGKKFCECKEHFTGLRCQDRESPLFSELFERSHAILRLETILIAAILGVVIVLLITLLSLVYTVCRMQDSYSKVLLNSSRSKQSLRLDRMVALATANHLPVFCDMSSQTDSCQPNDFALNKAVEASRAVPAKQKHNKCTTTRHNHEPPNNDPPVATNCNAITSGCSEVIPNGSKLVSLNCAPSGGICQRRNDGFVSRGGLTTACANGAKQGGCNPTPCGNNQIGCNRLSAGSGVSVGCQSKLSSSSQDCNQSNCKPATSSVVTVADCELVTSPAVTKRDSSISVATVPATSNLAASTGHCHEPYSNGPSGNYFSRPCSDIQVTEGQPLGDEVKMNHNPLLNHRSTSVVVVVETEEVAVLNRPLSAEYCHTESKLPAVVQVEDISFSPLKVTPMSSQGKIKSDGGQQQPSSNLNSADSEHEHLLHLPFAYEKSPNCNGEASETSSQLHLDHCSLDTEANCQRSVHTVPKHNSNSNSKRNILSERCSSDYERNSPASDLEVNMESEVDIQALNASEEELGRDPGQPRLMFHNNYESSVDTTDSESSLSSHEQDQSLLNRLKSQQPHLMDSSTEEGNSITAGGDAAAPVELDWEKFSCPFNFGALDHTFTLNPYDIIYANKYLARNQPKGCLFEKNEDANNAGTPLGMLDQYPYDPDPDATVV